MLSLALAAVWPSEAEADEQLPEYTPAQSVSGQLSSTGSDTLANLMTLWAEAFKRKHRKVKIEVQAPGSSTAPTALTESTVTFGPMSRLMTVSEVDAFSSVYGYQPTPVRVAIDALAIVVHKDNPTTSLGLTQLDAIFSTTRRCGAAQPIAHWGAIGHGGSWARRSVQLYGRNSASGTYGYFKLAGLCGGDFKNSVNEQPGSASVVQAVGSSLNGIGYSGIGYLTSGVKVLALSPGPDQPAVAPSPESALSGAYPLTRHLYIYVDRLPGAPLRPAVREFLLLVLSRQGQEIVAKDGYIPLPAATVHQERAIIDQSEALSWEARGGAPRMKTVVPP